MEGPAPTARDPGLASRHRLRSPARRDTPAPTESPKARAVKLLARREHSARELKRKLEARGIGAEQAASAVAELGREGWQSDERFAEMLVRSRVGQGYGPVRIEAELRMAGIPSAQIGRVMDESGADWRALAAQAHAKRFGVLPKSSAERAKQYRFLQGRGFDGAQIQAVLRGEGFDD